MEKRIGAEHQVDSYAQVLFDFERSDDSLEKCEFCVAFGSHDPHVAMRAAEVYLEGLADRIIFTGGFGRITSKTQNITEASLFKKIAMEAGVPSAAIVVEEQSTNTGENIELTRNLLSSLGASEQRLIFVERPYREVRTRATLEAQWDQLNYLMTSPALTYEDYCRFYENSELITKADFIALMVGDLQRILVYPSRGYQAVVNVPDYVITAYEALVDMGYVNQMLE